MEKLCCLVGACAILLGFSQRLDAQNSHQTIAFQGFVTDDLGAPLNDVVPIVFKIYRSSPFDLLWTETHPAVDVTDGIFEVALGSITPFGGTLDFDRAYELGISVDGDTEISPRTPLRSVPYALNLGGAMRVGVVDDAVNVFAADNIIGGKGHVAPDVVGATISGGGNTDEPDHRNRVYADYGSVGGGYGNQAGAFTEDNIPKTTNDYATVGGGYFNAAGGRWATVPGGYWNRANGRYSFAAGRRAEAMHSGTFVWSDTSSTLGAFTSTGPNQFLIRAGEGVGIGTNAPKRGLTISRPTEAAAYQLELRNVGDIHGTFFDGIAFTQSATGATELASIKVIYHSNGLPDLSFSVRNAANALFIEANTGDVGIGTTSPVSELDVNGLITTVSLNETSDARFKRDVRPLSDALSKVMDLQGVSYDWNQDDWPDRVFDSSRQIGLIAQDVQAVVPEVVETSEDGFHSVAYARLVPVLLEAMKEQQNQIQSLQEEIRVLKTRIGS